MGGAGMKITFADATGCPFGQFVVEAENDVDSTILKIFLVGKDYAKDKWEFWQHGSVYQGGKCISFNFGWINRTKYPKKAEFDDLRAEFKEEAQK